MKNLKLCDRCKKEKATFAIISVSDSKDADLAGSMDLCGKCAAEYGILIFKWFHKKQ